MRRKNNFGSLVSCCTAYYCVRIGTMEKFTGISGLLLFYQKILPQRMHDCCLFVLVAVYLVNIFGIYLSSISQVNCAALAGSSYDTLLYKPFFFLRRNLHYVLPCSRTAICLKQWDEGRSQNYLNFNRFLCGISLRQNSGEYIPTVVNSFRSERDGGYLQSHIKNLNQLAVQRKKFAFNSVSADKLTQNKNENGDYFTQYFRRTTKDARNRLSVMRSIAESEGDIKSEVKNKARSFKIGEAQREIGLALKNDCLEESIAILEAYLEFSVHNKRNGLLESESKYSLNDDAPIGGIRDGKIHTAADSVLLSSASGILNLCARKLQFQQARRVVSLLIKADLFFSLDASLVTALVGAAASEGQTAAAAATLRLLLQQQEGIPARVFDTVAKNWLVHTKNGWSDFLHSGLVLFMNKKSSAPAAQSLLLMLTNFSKQLHGQINEIRERREGYIRKYTYIKGMRAENEPKQQYNSIVVDEDLQKCVMEIKSLDMKELNLLQDGVNKMSLGLDLLQQVTDMAESLTIDQAKDALSTIRQTADIQLDIGAAVQSYPTNFNQNEAINNAHFLSEIPVIENSEDALSGYELNLNPPLNNSSTGMSSNSIGNGSEGIADDRSNVSPNDFDILEQNKAYDLACQCCVQPLGRVGLDLRERHLLRVGVLRLAAMGSLRQLTKLLQFESFFRVRSKPVHAKVIPPANHKLNAHSKDNSKSFLSLYIKPSQSNGVEGRFKEEKHVLSSGEQTDTPINRTPQPITEHNSEDGRRVELRVKRFEGFTVVLDAANIAYNSQNHEEGHFSFAQVEAIRAKLSSAGERPLIILPGVYYYGTKKHSDCANIDGKLRERYSGAQHQHGSTSRPSIPLREGIQGQDKGKNLNYDGVNAKGFYEDGDGLCSIGLCPKCANEVVIPNQSKSSRSPGTHSFGHMDRGLFSEVLSNSGVSYNRNGLYRLICSDRRILDRWKALGCLYVCSPGCNDDHYHLLATLAYTFPVESQHTTKNQGKVYQQQGAQRKLLSSSHMKNAPETRVFTIRDPRRKRGIMLPPPPVDCVLEDIASAGVIGPPSKMSDEAIVFRSILLGPMRSVNELQEMILNPNTQEEHMRALKNQHNNETIQKPNIFVRQDCRNSSKPGTQDDRLNEQNQHIKVEGSDSVGNKNTPELLSKHNSRSIENLFVPRPLVTNDCFRDHRLASYQGLSFRRWRSLALLRFEFQDPYFSKSPAYSIPIQGTQNTSTEGNSHMDHLNDLDFNVKLCGYLGNDLLSNITQQSWAGARNFPEWRPVQEKQYDTSCWRNEIESNATGINEYTKDGIKPGGSKIISRVWHFPLTQAKKTGSEDIDLSQSESDQRSTHRHKQAHEKNIFHDELMSFQNIHRSSVNGKSADEWWLCIDMRRLTQRINELKARITNKGNYEFE